MKRTLFTFAVGAWILGAIASRPLSAQDKKAETPDTAALVKELREAIADKKGAKDTEARQIIDKLVASADKMDAKQKKDTVSAVKQVFTAKRTPETAELFVAATEALSRMGPDGARALEGVIKEHTFKEKEWQTFRAQAVEALGKTADKDAVKTLTDLFNDKYDKILAAAGKALGYYGGAADAVRKEIVSDMVKDFNAIYNASKASVDPGNAQQQTFVERYNAIQEPWNNSLAQLTGQSFREPTQWEKWWNENKKKPWPSAKASGEPKDAKGEKGKEGAPGKDGAPGKGGAAPGK